MSNFSGIVFCGRSFQLHLLQVHQFYRSWVLTCWANFWVTTLSRYMFNMWYVISYDWILQLMMSLMGLFSILFFSEDNSRVCSPPWLVPRRTSSQIWFQAYYSFKAWLDQVLWLRGCMNSLYWEQCYFFFLPWFLLSVRVSDHVKIYVIGEEERPNSLLFRSGLGRCGIGSDMCIYIYINI